MNRLILACSLLTSLVFALPLRAQTFTNGQDAIGVIGQRDFLSILPSNLSNRLNAPRGVAYDAVYGKIYIADSANHRVLRYPVQALLQPGTMPECVLGQANFTDALANQGLAAPTARTLNFPRSVLVDSEGRLWVADGNNNRILRFDNAAFLGNDAPASAVLGQGSFTTATASVSATTLNGPHGLCIDANDALWVADRFNNRVLRYNAVSSKANGAAADLVIGQTNFTNGAIGVAANRLSSPVGICLDAAGNLWVADSDNNRVLRFDGATGMTTHGAAASLVLGQPDFTSNGVNRGGTRAANTLSLCLGVFVDAAGSLWVADSFNRRVLRYSSASTLTNGAAADLVLGQENFIDNDLTARADRTQTPIHITSGPDGSLLVTDFSYHRVLRFGPINVAPTITLTGPATRTTTQSTIALRGTATDPGGAVASIRATVNNRPTHVSGTGFWSLRVLLRKGVNVIKLRSVDHFGLSSGVVTVTVIRR
ncbi:MAG: NHL repeat-containing protein [Verrucomicrobiales bacterium]|nr:NHL repeat-containing protein [Verrucomicrobiales bacterium]